jgi:FG-GAP-like repeat
MRGSGSFIRGVNILAGCVVLALGSANTNLRGQNNIPGESPTFEANIGSHESQTESLIAPESLNSSGIPEPDEIDTPTPTRSSFMATWTGARESMGYLLDVSTDPSFSNYLEGYHDLQVGDVTGRVVTGLTPGTTYYYRVRAYDVTGAGDYSATVRSATQPATGLNINPTFDSSITGNPNAAAIEAAINRAISIYESLFSDPITIQIRFRYSTTQPNGTPMAMGTISRSDYGFYAIPWSTFISSLRADARTSNDFLANTSLPGTALSTYVTPSSANGRAVALNTPTAMFSNGTVGQGGPYDGIVTLNSAQPFQFTRPPSGDQFDAQRSVEHEIDEVIGFGSHLNISGMYSGDLRPQDLFSWSSAGNRNTTSNGTRYFSINGGDTNIVNFNQNRTGDFGDWLSTGCPQAHPYVQNAFVCTGQFSDIIATSPEGINLDVIGYDLATGPPPTPAAYDFNGDGHPDYLLYNSDTQQTLIGYLNNNVLIGSAFGPGLPAGWSVVAVADFNLDGHPDYLLSNAATGDTVIWYMNNNVHVTGAVGPRLPAGWSVVAVADFNLDGHPDYLLSNAATGDTVIWYMNNNVHVTGAYGPRLPAGWNVAGATDFNGDAKPDYLLSNRSTLQTVIWYMNNNVLVTGASGPTLPVGWSLVAP